MIINTFLDLCEKNQMNISEILNIIQLSLETKKQFFIYNYNIFEQLFNKILKCIQNEILEKNELIKILQLFQLKT